MGKISRANLKKTIFYLKRNGVKGTFYAVRERLDGRYRTAYRWTPPTAEELREQRRKAAREGYDASFSIVVPAYRTPERYLRELIASVRAQSYEKWELILADATEDDSVRRIVEAAAAEYPQEERIRYHRLSRNGGIAENTNQAIALAEKEYVGLLDHDDILTADALYEMAAAIWQSKKSGIEPELLYSDEDKCDGDGNQYYEPNYKEKFNLDLLLTNNYICHFLVMRRELIQKLKLRGEYNGAQDFDLVLRAAAGLSGREECIRHVPKVLYHWRCHASSTADNPQSKLYAYEAGRRAVQDFLRQKGWRAKVRDTAHLGFYEIEYEGTPLKIRKDLGAVGGRVIEKGRVVGGRMSGGGKLFYEGLPKEYSGYMHRARSAQEAEALDIRNIEVAEELRSCVEEITGVPYVTRRDSEIFDASVLPRGTDYITLSLKVSAALRAKGFRLLYDPRREMIIKNQIPRSKLTRYRA